MFASIAHCGHLRILLGSARALASNGLKLAKHRDILGSQPAIHHKIYVITRSQIPNTRLCYITAVQVLIANGTNVSHCSRVYSRV